MSTTTKIALLALVGLTTACGSSTYMANLRFVDASRPRVEPNTTLWVAVDASGADAAILAEILNAVEQGARASGLFVRIVSGTRPANTATLTVNVYDFKKVTRADWFWWKLGGPARMAATVTYGQGDSSAAATLDMTCEPEAPCFTSGTAALTTEDQIETMSRYVARFLRGKAGI